MTTATLIAGIPAHNDTLYHRIRFAVGDPAACLELPEGRLLIVRDIEMDRARTQAHADRVACPADFTPEGGLDGDRETATAQAAAEALRQHGIQEVVADRTLGLLFVEQLRAAGIALRLDPNLGVAERRQKDAKELEMLHECQCVTESAVRMACERIAAATPNADGVLLDEGEPLTSERMQAIIDIFLLQQGFAGSDSIVAGAKDGGDCHERGTGALRTEEPIIVDIFPRSARNRYNGDCTRTVVHGAVSDQIQGMHAAVVAAKEAAVNTLRTGVKGSTVHQATVDTLNAHGFAFGFPGKDHPSDAITMPHGTGHGLGLAVHEPPLLDDKGVALVKGDVVTIEPGLYGTLVGGIRVEDVYVVQDDGASQLGGTLHEGLTWSG